MKLKISWLIVLTALFLSSGSVVLEGGQPPPIPVKLQAAMQSFDRGDFRLTLDLVNGYLDETPDSPYTSVAYLLAGRSSLGLGDTHQALHYANLVLDLQPGDQMAAQAHYLSAAAFQARNDVHTAALELIACLNLSPQGKVSELARAKLSELAQGAMAYHWAGLRELARSDLSRQALEKLQPESRDELRLGVVIQNIEEDSTAGPALLDGIRAAVEKAAQQLDLVKNGMHKQHESAAPSLDNHLNSPSTERSALPDSVSDESEAVASPDSDIVRGKVRILADFVTPEPIQTVLAARSLIRDKGVWGLIVYGHESDVVAAAVEAQASGVPVVLPGLRRPGLFAIGPTTVQPEADWYREGQLTAEYAADSLGLRTYAVVAPATPRGQANAAGFTDVLKEREDVNIMALEWYFPEEGISLTRQFLRIREIGFRRLYTDSLLSADTVLARQVSEADSSEAMLDSLWREHLQVVRVSPLYRSGAIDSNDIELDAIDAFYLPIEPGTIELFAPQFAFYSFRTQRFGNSAWYNPEELYRQRQYTDDLVFFAPYNLDSKEKPFNDLAAYLYKEKDVIPGPWHIRGYDAATLILTPALEGKVGSAGIADGLRHLQKVSLASGEQQFDSQRRLAQRMWRFTVHEGSVREEIRTDRLMKLAHSLDDPPSEPPQPKNGAR